MCVGVRAQISFWIRTAGQVPPRSAAFESKLPDSLDPLVSSALFEAWKFNGPRTRTTTLWPPFVLPLSPFSQPPHPAHTYTHTGPHQCYLAPAFCRGLVSLVGASRLARWALWERWRAAPGRPGRTGQAVPRRVAMRPPAARRANQRPPPILPALLRSSLIPLW